MKHASTQRGSVVLQVALVVVVLLGFTALTTDYGLLVMRQRQLQNGVDAAALSGAADLYGPESVGVAKDKARQTAATAGVPNVVVTVNTTDTPYTVTVKSTDYVPTIFARVLNPSHKTGRASATGTAAKPPATMVSRLRPWGVPWAFFNGGGVGLGNGGVHYNELATLALSPIGTESPNDLGQNQTYISPLALDGRPEPVTGRLEHYSKYVRQGYDRPVSISPLMSATVIGQPGDLETLSFYTEQALKSGDNSLFRQAADNQYAGNDWQNPGDSPRVVFLPVIDQMIGGEALIEGFAAFYIEDIQHNQIRGRFIHYNLPYNADTPGTLDPAYYVPGLTERPQLIK